MFAFLFHCIHSVRFYSVSQSNYVNTLKKYAWNSYVLLSLPSRGASPYAYNWLVVQLTLVCCRFKLFSSWKIIETCLYICFSNWLFIKLLPFDQITTLIDQLSIKNWKYQQTLSVVGPKVWTITLKTNWSTSFCQTRVCLWGPDSGHREVSHLWYWFGSN